MNHNELLKKLADMLNQMTKKTNNQQEIKTLSSEDRQEMNSILNKIGLEIQREGGGVTRVN